MDMLLGDRDMVWEEISRLGFDCDDRDICDDIRVRTSDRMWQDKELMDRIYEILDEMIMEADLPELPRR